MSDVNFRWQKYVFYYEKNLEGRKFLDLFDSFFYREAIGKFVNKVGSSCDHIMCYKESAYEGGGDTLKAILLVKVIRDFEDRNLFQFCIHNMEFHILHPHFITLYSFQFQ